MPKARRDVSRPADKLDGARDAEDEQARYGPGRSNGQPAAQRRTLGGWAPPLGGALVAIALAAAVYALDSTLPEPAGATKIAVAAYRALARTEIRGSIERSGHLRAVRVACRRASDGRTVVAMSTGQRFVVLGTGARVIGPRRDITRARLLAEVGLSGCVDPLYVGFSARLINQRRVFRGATRFAGRPAYRFQFTGEQRVYLVAARDTLAPLGIEYATPKLRGTSVLLTQATSRKPRPQAAPRVRPR